MLAKAFATEFILLINFEIIVCNIIKDNLGFAFVIDSNLLMKVKKEVITK